MYFPLGAPGSYEIGWATPVNKNLPKLKEKEFCKIITTLRNYTLNNYG